MTGTNYPRTRQGVRDLNTPVRRDRDANPPAHQERGNSKVNVGDVERGLSKLGGAVLAGLGVGRGGLLGLAAAACGAGLLYRGMTGHCYAYQAAGIDTAHGDKG